MPPKDTSTAPAGNRPATFDHLKKKLPMERTVTISLSDDESVTLRFRSIGRRNYDALIGAHPATEQQKADAKATGAGEPPYDADTFAPALVAASCIEPVMTLDQVRELWDEWNTAEVLDLWVAALEVNTQRRVVDLGKDSG